MKRRLLVVFGVLAASCTFISASFAYQTIDVKNGGTIEGIVEYAGPTIPRDPSLTLTSETAYCGQILPARKYLIRDRKIQNVIVYLTGVTTGKPLPRETVTITNRKCEFVPHVTVGFKGNAISMKTDDPVLHTFDVHASVSGRELYHLTLHQQGSSVKKKLPPSGLLELSCYIHPWQHAYIDVFDHPYATVTDEEGRFVIRDVPPGVYTVETWHEALGAQRREGVKVESGGTSVVQLKYAGER